MSKLFDDNRIYVLGDSDLALIGNREKLAQWRHKKTGPAFYKLGRKIVYRGYDLNAWAEDNRIDPKSPEVDSEKTTQIQYLPTKATNITVPDRNAFAKRTGGVK